MHQTRGQPVHLKAILAAALVLLLCGPALAADWALRKSRSNPDIKVYTRSVEGSDIMEFRGETTLQSSLGGVVALLKDTSNLPNWIYAMLSIETLERSSDQNSITYSTNKTGPFMDNRDSIVRSVISQEPKTGVVTIALTGLPGYIPTTEGNVRVSHLQGTWQFSAHSSGSIKVVYQIHADPAGRLPRSLINRFLVKSPLQTLAAMHKQIGKYQGQKFPFIRESN